MTKPRENTLEELIRCPHCGKKQAGNRNACYNCGAVFLYKSEQAADEK